MVCEDAPFNVNGDEYVLKIDGNTTFRYFEFSLLQDGIAYYTPSITYFPETEQALTFQYGDPSKGYYVGPTITPFYGNEMVCSANVRLFMDNHSLFFSFFLSPGAILVQRS